METTNLESMLNRFIEQQLVTIVPYASPEQAREILRAGRNLQASWIEFQEKLDDAKRMSFHTY